MYLIQKIINEYLKHRDKIRKDIQQDYIKNPRYCCDPVNSVKIIDGHGSISERLMPLHEGYKVIYLTQFGSKLNSGINIEELEDIYIKGSSLFENNDQLQDLSNDGLDWMETYYRGNYSIDPLLFIGSNKVFINSEHSFAFSICIPDVLCHFDVDCNNFENITELDDNEKIGEQLQDICYITCISPGKIERCDKYYGKKSIFK